MENTTGEIPATTEAGETPVTPVVAPQEVAPEVTGKGEMPGDAEAEGLRKALKAERALREAAEKAAKQTARTTEERVADLERRNQELVIERLANATVDKMISGLGDSFTVSRSAILEELEDAKLTEANMESVIGRWVNKLKRPNTVKTPENTATPMTPTGKTAASINDPYADF